MCSLYNNDLILIIEISYKNSKRIWYCISRRLWLIFLFIDERSLKTEKAQFTDLMFLKQTIHSTLPWLLFNIILYISHCRSSTSAIVIKINFIKTKKIGPFFYILVMKCSSWRLPIPLKIIESILKFRPYVCQNPWCTHTSWFVVAVLARTKKITIWYFHFGLWNVQQDDYQPLWK